MASKRSVTSLLQTAAPSLRSARPSQPALTRTSACAFSTTTPSRAPEHDIEAADRPRWQQTPPRMVAPFRIRPQPRGPVFTVNEDPRKLDDVFVRMLGPGGDKMLSDEVKWLAVTHKSFDHGRRGFNDRLAFLGAFQTGVGGGKGMNRITNQEYRQSYNLTTNFTSPSQLATSRDLAKRRPGQSCPRPLRPQPLRTPGSSQLARPEHRRKRPRAGQEAVIRTC